MTEELTSSRDQRCQCLEDIDALPPWIILHQMTLFSFYFVSNSELQAKRFIKICLLSFTPDTSYDPSLLKDDTWILAGTPPQAPPAAPCQSA